MTQYQHQESTQDLPAPKSSVRNRDTDALRQQLEQQSHEIDALKRTVRKLQNELRLAVNTFNLRNHG